MVSQPEPEPVPAQGVDDTMEIEQTYPAEPSPLPPHEPSPRPYPRGPRDGRAAYREDYTRDARQADPNYQDGRYGFNEHRYNEPRYDDRRSGYRDQGQGQGQGRMYSDDMMRGSRRGGGRGRYRG